MTTNHDQATNSKSDEELIDNTNVSRMRLKMIPPAETPINSSFIDVYAQGLERCFSPFYNTSTGFWFGSQHQFIPGDRHEVHGYFVFSNPFNCSIPVEGHQDITFSITGSLNDDGHHNLFLIRSLNAWDYDQQYVLKCIGIWNKARVYSREFDVMRYLSSFESVKENIISV